MTWVFVLICTRFFWGHYYSTTNQLRLLQHGSVKQKIIAADILGKRGVGGAVPFLIENIDVDEGGAYITKSPESLSCIASVALDNITHVGIGDACCYFGDCKKESESNRKMWREWYLNEYPSWAKQYE